MRVTNTESYVRAGVASSVSEENNIEGTFFLTEKCQILHQNNVNNSILAIELILAIKPLQHYMIAQVKCLLYIIFYQFF